MTINKSILSLIIFVFILLVGYVIVTSYVNRKLSSDMEERTTLYKADSAKLVIYKNKYNEEVAKSVVLTSTTTKLFTELQTKDENTRKLQQLVIKYEKENKELNSALIIANTTIIHLQDSIENHIVDWEVDKDSIKYPVYTRSFNIDSCFTSGNIVLGKHKFDINLKTDNEYEVVIGNEKINIFKTREFAEITNKNKCTNTKALKVYDKKEKSTNVVKPFMVGASTTAIIVLILKFL